MQHCRALISMAIACLVCAPAPAQSGSNPIPKRPPAAGEKSSDDLARRADEAYRAGNLSLSADLLRRQLQLRPDNAAIHYNLACCLGALNDQEKSGDSLMRAVELGFSDVRRIRREPALEQVRKQDRVADLLERWPEVLEDQAHRTLALARQRFADNYHEASDPDLRLNFLSAGDQRLVAQARRELTDIAAWADAAVFPGLLDPDQSALDPWVVVVLPGRKDFDRWLTDTYGASARGSFSQIGGAYLHPGKRLVAMDLGATLRHEFFHVLHHRMSERLGQSHPIWIQEGLAMLVEDVEGSGASLHPVPSWRTNAAQRMARSGAMMSLDRLAAQTPAQFSTTRPLANYAHARAFFMYLLDKGALSDWFRTYTTDRERGYTADPSGVRALESALGKDPAAIDKDLRAWLRELPSVAEEIQPGMASLGVQVDAGMGEGPIVAAADAPDPRDLRRTFGPLVAGDVILAIDGRPTRDIAELVRVLGSFEPGQRVAVSRRRAGAIEDVTVTLGRK